MVEEQVGMEYFLSTDASGIHLQMQGSHGEPAEKGQESLTTQKE